MTTGELIFTCGLGLLVLTALLAVLFLVKKPRYAPEKAVYAERVSNKTQRLRNGYPTDPLTVRRTPSSKTVPMEEAVEETEVMATLPLLQETELPDEQTVPLPEDDGVEKTVLLEERAQVLAGEKTVDG